MKLPLKAPTILFGGFSFTALLSYPDSDYHPYSDLYYLYLISCFFVFGLSYFFGKSASLYLLKIRMPRMYFKNENGVQKLKSPKFHFNILVRIFGIGIFAGTVLNIVNHYLIVGTDFMYPLGIELYRQHLTVDEGAVPIPFAAIFNILFLTGPLFLIAYKERFSPLFNGYLTASILLYVYLSSARSSLFVLVLLTFYFLNIGREINLKGLLVLIGLVALCIGGFAFIGEIVGKPVAELSLGSYLIAPSHALDQILTGEAKATLSDVWLSFRPLHGVIQSWFNIDLNSGILPNLYTPFPTNVYTLFGVYVNDYGIIGSIAWTVVFGLISGALEGMQRERPENIYLRVLVSLNLTILTLSIFYDYYTSSAFVWMIFIFGAVLFPNNPGNGDEIMTRTALAH